MILKIMQWKLFIKLTSSFVELIAYSSSHQPSIRKEWFLPNLSFKKGLSEFLQQHQISIEQIEDIYLTTQFLEHVLEKNLWDSGAFLVTSGFEHWLSMSLPQSSSTFHYQSERVPSPLNPELTFAINERVRSNGHMEKEVDLQELESLLPKLELHKIKSLSLGFVNAHTNSHNALKARDFFTERGYQVFFSIDPLENHPFSETDYWLTNIFKASTYHLYLEYIYGLFDDFQLSSKLRLLTEKGSQPLESTDFFDTIFMEQRLIYESIQKQMQSKAHFFIYAGYESFELGQLRSEPLHWLSKWGELPIKKPPLIPLLHQPTQELIQGSQHLPDFEFEQTQSLYRARTTGYEPGPVSLGKGMRLTLLDLMYHHHGITNTILPLQSQRKNLIIESLTSLSNGSQRIDRSAVLDSLLSLVAKNTYTDLIMYMGQRDQDLSLAEVEILGPLSKPLFHILSQHCRREPLKLHHNPSFQLSPDLGEAFA